MLLLQGRYGIDESLLSPYDRDVLHKRTSDREVEFIRRDRPSAIRPSHWHHAQHSLTDRALPGRKGDDVNWPVPMARPAVQGDRSGVGLSDLDTQDSCHFWVYAVV